MLPSTAGVRRYEWRWRILAPVELGLFIRGGIPPYVSVLGHEKAKSFAPVSRPDVRLGIPSRAETQTPRLTVTRTASAVLPELDCNETRWTTSASAFVK